MNKNYESIRSCFAGVEAVRKGIEIIISIIIIDGLP